MARVIIDLNKISFSLADKNEKYFFYNLRNNDTNNNKDTERSINYKIKIADNSNTSSYLTNTDSNIFGKA